MLAAISTVAGNLIEVVIIVVDKRLSVRGNLDDEKPNEFLKKFVEALGNQSSILHSEIQQNNYRK